MICGKVKFIKKYEAHFVMVKTCHLGRGQLWGRTSFAYTLQPACPCPARAASPALTRLISMQNIQACKLRATNGFETIYDIRPLSTCISIYLVSLTYTLFFQNHKQSCWNFMWKCLRGWKLTPLWSSQPHGGCETKASLSRLSRNVFLTCSK